MSAINTQPRQYIKHAEDFGLSTSATGASNRTTLQTLIALGGRIEITEPGTYDYAGSGADNPYSSGHTYCFEFTANNTTLYIGKGVTLRRATNTQINRASTGTGPCDDFIMFHRTGITIICDGVIDGNTSNQSYTGGYAQVTNGCGIFAYYTSTTDITGVNQDITVVGSGEIKNYFSNPVNLEGVNHCKFGYGLRFSNFGEGPEIVASFHVRAEDFYLEPGANCVGDGFELASCCYFSARNIRCVGHSSWTAGTVIDPAYSCIGVISDVLADRHPGLIDFSFTSTLFTDGVIDASDNTIMTSATASGLFKLGRAIRVWPSGNGTPGLYPCRKLNSATSATFTESPGSVGTTGINFTVAACEAVQYQNIFSNRSIGTAIAMGDGQTNGVNVMAVYGQSTSSHGFQLQATANRGDHKITNGVFRSMGRCLVIGTGSVSLLNTDVTYSKSGAGISVEYSASDAPILNVVGGDFSNNTTYPIAADGQGAAIYEPEINARINRAWGNGTLNTVEPINGATLALSNVIHPNIRIQSLTNGAINASNAKRFTTASFNFNLDHVGNMQIETTAGVTAARHAIIGISGTDALVANDIGATGTTGISFKLHAVGTISEPGGYIVAVNNRSALSQISSNNGRLDGLIALDADSPNQVEIGRGNSSNVHIAGTLSNP